MKSVISSPPVRLAHAWLGVAFAVAAGSTLAVGGNRSGIEGTVTLSPTCGGPQREGVDCRVPYADVELRLLRKDGSVASQAKTSPSGQYRLPAPAGHYQVQVMRPNKITRCPRLDAVVEPRGYTAIDIECDSGIR